MKTACKNQGASDNSFNSYDLSKGNLLLEVFALEIQMCIETKEQRRMKDVFIMTEKFSSVIEDPRVVGIIKECGGKMYMSEKRWELAHQEFIASFTSLVDCGAARASVVLKYVILASLLSDSKVDYLT
jgi:COP9 signalosome complex subunit 2